MILRENFEWEKILTTFNQKIIFIFSTKMWNQFTFSSDTLSDCLRCFYQKQGQWTQAASSSFGCFKSC